MDRGLLMFLARGCFFLSCFDQSIAVHYLSFNSQENQSPPTDFPSEQTSQSHFLKSSLLISFSIPVFILLQITSTNHVFLARYRAVINSEQGSVY